MGPGAMTQLGRGVPESWLNEDILGPGGSCSCGYLQLLLGVRKLQW